MYKPELLRFFGNIKNGLPLSLSTFLVVYSYFLYLTDWLFDISFTQTNSYFSLSILFNLNVHLKGGKRMMQVCHIDYHGLGGSWLLIAALILSFHFHFLIFHNIFLKGWFILVGAGLGGSWQLSSTSILIFFHFHFLSFTYIFHFHIHILTPNEKVKRGWCKFDILDGAGPGGRRLLSATSNPSLVLPINPLPKPLL